MSLSRYKEMRRFADTPEPSGGEASGDALIFVVQLHHASHRHYDFRLELDGVLKSWAVPKGPSFDPSVKRLAVQVEDHPLDYATFQGIIPEGNYGAGDVLVFDHGTWVPDGDPHAMLKKGHVRFALLGDKLRGAWDLVRTGGRGGKPQWLLRKAEDDEAGAFEADDLIGDPEDLPPLTAVWESNRRKDGTLKAPKTASRRAVAPAKRKSGLQLDLEGAVQARIDTAFFEPELAKKQDAPPSGDYLHEPKWDGYRLLACVGKGEVRLWSRNGIEWTDKVPDVTAAIAALGTESLRLDGELIAVGKHKGATQADFNALQARLSDEGGAKLRYVVFDVLHLNGVDVSGCGLRARKRVLELVMKRNASPLLTEGLYETGDGKKLLPRWIAKGYEGLVSKKADAPYRAGRNGDWVKCRSREAEELAIVGYTEPRGSRAGIGALLMGRPTKAGWDYAGRVGTGMSNAVLAKLRGQLAPKERDTPAVRAQSLVGPRASGDLRGVHWVEPLLAVEVEHHGRGGGGLLRQPSVKAIRHDKRAQDLTPGGDLVTDEAKPAKKADLTASGMRLTHPERIVYPDKGLTKGDVFAYYEAIAPLILPELSGRPLALVRCPAGNAGQAFFQKHTSPGFSSAVHGSPRGSKSGDAHVWIDSVEGLLSLAQMNVLELHVWGGTVADIDHADRMVIDLDPAEDVPWKRVVAAAVLVRKLLKGAGLESFVRLTGGKGLHVVAPLSPAASWDDTKAFTHRIATALTEARPDEFVDVMTKAKRGGKIFVDYLRNGRGATAVCSYSLRNKPSATVAMPITWAELAKVKGADAYDLRSALAYLARRKKDPWPGFTTLKQGLPRTK